MDPNIFKNASKTWSDKKETVCGSGSTLQNTVNVRNNLPLLLSKYQIKSMFDAPCGDGNWIQHCDLTGVEYFGGDLVHEFVSNNSMSNVRQFDITVDDLPPVDLWMCRACLYHLSFDDINLAIEMFKRSKVKYALITSHVTDKKANDINTGGFRYLNLSHYEYFGLGEPIDRFDDVLYNNMLEEMLLFVNKQ